MTRLDRVRNNDIRGRIGVMTHLREEEREDGVVWALYEDVEGEVVRAGVRLGNKE